MSKLQDLKTTSMMSLQSLIDMLQDDETLPEARRREMISAIRTIAKVLKREPHLIPAAADQLRDLLKRALPTAAGVSSTRFRNAKSLLRKALGMLDPLVIPARSRAALLREWDDLLAEPAAKPLQRGLARFSKYCSTAGIPPDEVTQHVYDQFYEDLVAHCLIRSPRETQQTAGHAWNKASQCVPGWPQLTLHIRSFRRNPSLPWSAFPKSLEDDVDAFLNARSPDVFDLSQDVPLMRASSSGSKRSALRQFATCLVEAGRDPMALCSLADLVRADAAYDGLMVLHKRAAGQKTSRNHGMAYLLLSIARYCVKSDPKTIEDLKKFCHNLRPRNHGMTAKNRLRLKQFDNPKLLGSLLSSPAAMMAEACREANPTKGEARIAQLAVAIEILLMAPLRIKNLAQLEVGRTLILDGSTIGHIVIDHSEVKNELDIEIPLPDSALRLINVYLKRFHPLLAPPGCRMLFPSADGGHKRLSVLSDQIRRCVGLRCGIELNPHIFRHLAAKIYLDAFPGSYGIVRMLLGHKSIDTTIRTYCGMEFAHAFRQYDDYVNRMRGNNSKPTPAIRFAKGGR
jgi:integrase